MKRLSTVVLLLSAVWAISACSSRATAGPRRPHHQREDYLSRAQSQLNQFNQSISDLQVKASHAQANAKADLDAQLAVLRQKQAAAQQRVDRIKSASEESWQSLQSGADAALDDLKRSYDQAVARFKQAGG